MADKLLPKDLVFEGPFPRLSRRLRIGIVGGGRIAVTQAMAARLTDRWEVVAGALSSDPRLAKTRGAQWYLPEERCYSSYEEMARIEAQRPDGIDAVMITTPNHVHYDNVCLWCTQGARRHGHDDDPIGRRCPGNPNSDPSCVRKSGWTAGSNSRVRTIESFKDS